MIFTLNLRPVTEEDLSLSNPFLPEADDYEMYLHALRDDLEQINGVMQVAQVNSSLRIETNEPFSEKELRERIKPVFTEGLLKKLRFVSLVKSQSTDQA